MDITKFCKKCNTDKKLDYFYSDKNGKYGKHSTCIECHKIYKKSLSKEDIKIQNYNYYLKNSEKVKSSVQLYQKENKDIINEKKRIYIKNKRNNDPLFKLNDNIKTSIYNSFKNNFNNIYKKCKKTYNILGLSKEEFKNYIESKFKPWMTWENYGLYNGELDYGWDLDHIIPISSAKTEEDIYLLNHYTNFQPLCSKINRDIKRHNLNY